MIKLRVLTTWSKQYLEKVVYVGDLTSILNRRHNNIYYCIGFESNVTNTTLIVIFKIVDSDYTKWHSTNCMQCYIPCYKQTFTKSFVTKSTRFMMSFNYFFAYYFLNFRVSSCWSLAILGSHMISQSLFGAIQCHTSVSTFGHYR